MNYSYIKSAVEAANSRDIGQFHVFIKGRYHSTWHSFPTAKDIAAKYDGQVFNSFAHNVA